MEFSDVLYRMGATDAVLCLRDEVKLTASGLTSVVNYLSIWLLGWSLSHTYPSSFQELGLDMSPADNIADEPAL